MGKQCQLIVVDGEQEVVSHSDGLAVKGVLDALDELNDPADGQYGRLAHWLTKLQVESEEGLHHVAHTVGQQ